VYLCIHCVRLSNKGLLSAGAVPASGSKQAARLLIAAVHCSSWSAAAAGFLNSWRQLKLLVFLTPGAN